MGFTLKSKSPSFPENGKRFLDALDYALKNTFLFFDFDNLKCGNEQLVLDNNKALPMKQAIKKLNWHSQKRDALSLSNYIVISKCQTPDALPNAKSKP